MQNQIHEFYQSDHFLLQSWNRGVDSSVLKKILLYVKTSNQDKDLVIVAPSFFSRKGIVPLKKNCLVIIFKQRLLKTTFWCDDPSHLVNKEKNANIQILF